MPPLYTPDFIRLSALDWAIIGSYILFSLGVGFWFARRAGQNISEFFVSGRSLPWWLVGTSMVATTFSTDTPNFVTNIVREQGVWGYWRPWSFVLVNMLTVFFFARLWRRAALLTDIEFYEMRYSGKEAAFLRGFRAVYLGFFYNVLIMATVTLAAGKIGAVLFGFEPKYVVAVCALVAASYAMMAGLWGVIITDLVQFFMAIGGSIAATWWVLSRPEIGGLSGLLERLETAGRGSAANFFPDPSQPEVFFGFMVFPLLVLWWASWYPGSEPGGGGYIAQRMFASRDERNSLLSTLWFYMAHVALRPWPWFLMALASLVVFPEISHETLGDLLPNLRPEEFKHDLGYSLMLRLLPPGLIGIMLAAMGAAYMSTIDTHLNWGASYLINDFYKRFVARDRDDRHYVLASRLCTALLMACAALVSFWLVDSLGAFEIVMSIGAGTGLIFMLRWFWWRINAWTEISAMISATIVSLALAPTAFGGTLEFHERFLIVLGVTTVVWLTVTLLTRPTDPRTLDDFYRRIRPAGPGWAAVRRRVGGLPSPDSITWNFVGWAIGIVMLYTALFGIGSFCYLRPLAGTLLCGVSAGCLALLVWRRDLFLGYEKSCKAEPEPLELTSRKR